MISVGEALRDARARLKHAGAENPGLDARLLLGAILDLDAAALAARPEQALSEAEAHRFESFITRRAAGEPVARILGEKEFWGLSFALNAATLVPRPDTETLVQAILDEIKALSLGPRITICDLGTGSGAILIALLSELPEAEGLGVDLSEQAIKAARTNAGRCGIGKRAEFRVADLAHEPEGPFDIVVANPPYIPSAEIERLGTEVRDHDPRLALDGGPDGLDAYRAIAARSKELLRPGGLMAVEVGASQAQDVAAILVGSGQVLRRIVKDIAGIDRVVVTVSSQGDTKHPDEKSLGESRLSG